MTVITTCSLELSSESVRDCRKMSNPELGSAPPSPEPCSDEVHLLGREWKKFLFGKVNHILQHSVIGLF